MSTTSYSMAAPKLAGLTYRMRFGSQIGPGNAGTSFLYSDEIAPGATTNVVPDAELPLHGGRAG